MTVGSIGMAGRMSAQVKRCQRAPLGWRMRNWLRWSYIQGLLQFLIARLASALGVVTVTAALRVMVRRASGEWVDYGVVSRRKVTKAGVTFMANDFKDGSQDISNFKYHTCGTGTNAEANTDTTLQTECTTVLNPDSTRATGANQAVQGTDNNVFHTEGTLTFDGAAAVTEHGLVSTASGAYTLWDRSVFAAINVAGGDSILFKYDLTISYEA